MAKKVIHVDLTPIQEFRYCQISNYKFQYQLVDKDYRAIHSPFECKDYIQDIFYTEYTGHEGLIWGLYWKPGMLDTNVKYFNLAMLGGNVELKDHAPFLKEFLNTFESALGIPLSKVSETDDSKIILIQFSKNWTENGPLLSAYTTMIRIAGGYKGGDVLEYLKECLSYSEGKKDYPEDFPQYPKVDVSKLDRSLPRFKALLEGKRPEHNWENLDNMTAVHNTGLLGFKNFPRS